MINGVDGLPGRIREAREYLGLSQQFVSDQLGIHRASVTEIEKGRRKVSAEELAQLAKLLRRPAGWLLTGQYDPPVVLPPRLIAVLDTLSERDREEVTRFAEFIAHAGGPPRPREEKG